MQNTMLLEITVEVMPRQAGDHGPLVLLDDKTTRSLRQLIELAYGHYF